MTQYFKISALLCFLIVTSCKQTQLTQAVKPTNNPAADFSKMINGTWKLQSRISHGKEAESIGSIYFDLKSKGELFTGNELAAESGNLQSSVSPGGNNMQYDLAAYFNTTVSNAGTNSVHFNADGEILGSYEPFKQGVKMKQQYTFARSGKSFIMQKQNNLTADGKPLANDVSAELEVYDKIVLTNNMLTFYSTTLDLEDRYIKISDKQAKVGDILSLQSFWKIYSAK